MIIIIIIIITQSEYNTSATACCQNYDNTIQLSFYLTCRNSLHEGCGTETPPSPLEKGSYIKASRTSGVLKDARNTEIIYSFNRVRQIIPYSNKVSAATQEA